MSQVSSSQMTTVKALAELGVTEGDLSAEERNRLDEDGYVVIPDVFTPEEVEQLRHEFDRWEAREARLMPDYNIEPGSTWLIDLFNKSEVFDLCFRSKPTLFASHLLLGEIKVCSLNGRNPPKGAGQQLLHSDVYRFEPNDWRATNTLILLDEVSLENGPTRVIPGSHHWPHLNVPHDFDLQKSVAGADLASELDELSEDEKALIPEDPFAPHPQEVYITGRAGTICIINCNIWHGGTRNMSGEKRRLIHFPFVRRDTDPELVQRDHLTPSLRSRTSAAQKYLLDIEGAEAVVPDVKL